MNEEQEDRRGEPFLVSVAHSMAVLERLAAGGAMTLSDAAKELNVNKNIAHRLLFTLEKLGFIQEDPVSRKYKLTFKLLNLARTQWIKSDVLSQSEPILKGLARESGELVRLAIVEAGELRWVFAEIGAQRSLMIDPAYGGNIIPHVHATSKAYLMTLPEEELERRISRFSFTAYSPHTITDAETFKANICDARGDGFACSYEERDLGVAAVAAAVLGGDRQTGLHCVAVVSVSAPASRMSKDQIKAMARELLMPAVRRLQNIWPI
jgi:IclR family transcriptional regulator, acetate operon repressor